MTTPLLKKTSQKKQGFTIVELLIVIVVIAILAAITIVAYNGISQRAKQSAAASAATSAAKKALTYATVNSEQFPVDLPTAGVNNDANTVYEYSYDNTAKTYCITATFQQVSYYVSNSNPNPTAGLCVGHIGGSINGWSEILVTASFGGVSQSNACGRYNGALYCWGNNSYGQLGNGNTTSSSVPVAVTTSGALSGKTITAIAGGTGTMCAVASGQAYCWGKGAAGKLGNGGTADSSVPVAVDTSGVLAGKTVTAISVGYTNVCAVASGAVYCWGGQNNGGLGNNSAVDSSIPVAVDTSGVLAGKTVTAVGTSAGGSCAVANSAAYCWGNYWRGEGSSSNGPLVPVAVSVSGVLAGQAVSKLAGGVGSSGTSNTCALAVGAVYCWGEGTSGALGNSLTTNSAVPVAVTTSGVLSGKTITKISGGQAFYCAIASGGGAYCWGDGGYGKLGNGGSGTSSAPVAVTSGAVAGRTITDISAGSRVACAIADAQAYCVGYGSGGMLGNGGTSDSANYVQVTNP